MGYIDDYDTFLDELDAVWAACSMRWFQEVVSSAWLEMFACRDARTKASTLSCRYTHQFRSTADA